MLTDYYPNVAALERATGTVGDELHFCPYSVDARVVPPDLEGFRTLFTAFHHFPPEEARTILKQAVGAGAGIGIFELTHRGPFACATMAIGSPALALLLTPLTRPFRWSRLFWTYLVPAIPLVVAFDGFVSCLRTYSVSELSDMVSGLDSQHYEWEIGVARGLLPPQITYLIGHPSKSGA